MSCDPGGDGLTAPGGGRDRARGVFVMVVGPSGAGKDTLLAGARSTLARDDRFVFVQRVITRPPDRWEAHVSVSVETFERMRRGNAFALAWTAHELSYGIPSTVADHVRDGRIAVCNASRRVIPSARCVFERVAVIYVTAPRDVLRARLVSRGREAELDPRLDRISPPDAVGSADLIINNVGTIEEGSETLVNWLLNLPKRVPLANR